MYQVMQVHLNAGLLEKHNCN